MTHDGCQHKTPHTAGRRDLGAALSAAEQRCVDGGHRWTPQRQRVYELLLADGGPIKAYELMDRFRDGPAAKPPTVYRALEFLEEMGLVHRIASLNAYMACEASDRTHVAAFLICDCCGSAQEFIAGDVATARAAAEQHRFKAREVAVEVRGLCRPCLN